MSKSVAVVGASPRNFWTNCAIVNLKNFGQGLAIVPVTPNHPEVDGLQSVATVEELSEAPRAAIIAIRREASVEAIRHLVKIGTQDIVLVTDGFGERGDELGDRLQAELVEIVSGSRTRLWGPNCVGFADFTEGVCAIAEPVWLESRPGNVSIVSQSGALLSAFIAGAREENLGVDFCASTGNGALLGVPQAVDHVIDRATTEVVCVYLEGVAENQLDPLEAAFARASEMGKQVIVLKSGVSDRGRRAVMSHTASIAGTDTVFSDLLRKHGVIRAESVAEMMRIANLAALGVKHGRPRAVSVLGGSGGAAALTSDLAEMHGCELTRFAEKTIERITELAGPGSFIDNPLDVIGVKRREGDESINGLVFQDPNTGLVMMPWSVQFPEERPEQSVHTWNWNDLASLSERHEMPLVITAIGNQPPTDFVRDYRDRHPHVAVVQDLSLTVRALAKLFPERPISHDSHAATSVEIGVLSEHESRELVSQSGVPVVRGVLVPRGADPSEVASTLRPPLAVKVDAPISHKSRIGGVELGVSSHVELPATCARIETAVCAAGLAPADINGYLVEEMVFGREILVGLNTDEALGKYVVVGLGGTATELANCSTTRRLPLADGDLGDLLSGVGLDESSPLAPVLEEVAAEFHSGKLKQFATVELNPIIVNGNECWAADAVVTMSQESHALTGNPS